MLKRLRALVFKDNYSDCSSSVVLLTVHTDRRAYHHHMCLNYHYATSCWDLAGLQIDMNALFHISDPLNLMIRLMMIVMNGTL